MTFDKILDLSPEANLDKIFRPLEVRIIIKEKEVI